MKVVTTHFVMTITRPFGDEYREIKKVYELSAESGEFIIVNEGKQTYYEKITKEQFLKLKANGLEIDPNALLI